MASSSRDFLLKEVGQAFAQFADAFLRPQLRKSTADPTVRELATQLLVLHHRSREVFQDFGEFYCTRLLLDEQSSHASYFIDLFSQLHWMLDLLYMVTGCLHPDAVITPLYTPVLSITHTCRFLYILERMSPKFGPVDGNRTEEFRRAGRVGRMFSSNEIHCRMRQLGFVNLDQPGKSLVNLKETLGSGAFGTVYKGIFQADDLHSNRIIGEPVAVKMFASSDHGHESGPSFGTQLLQSMGKVSALESPDLQMLDLGDGVVKDTRLKIELGRLISARHPNIVTPRGYIGERPQGDCGLVMEIMDESLHDYLHKVEKKQVPPLTELEKLDLMLEIAKGMRFLHECNLMHRDLKPRNILLRHLVVEDLGCKRQFEVKLADFGLTKLYSIAREHGTMYEHTAPVGTTCYMAPELRDNADQKVCYEEKVDVFSYGTICFNILIGGTNPMAFVLPRDGFYGAVKTGRWRKWVQGIDPNLSYMKDLVARCWEIDPIKRPTFATLCVLLQYGLQCCLLSSSLDAYAFELNKGSSLQKDFDRLWNTYKFSYHPFRSHLIKFRAFGTKKQYQPDLAYFQDGNTLIGLEVIQNYLESKFCPNVKWLDLFDFGKDVLAFVKAHKSGYYKGLARAWEQSMGHLRTEPSLVHELMESCMKTPDPLILFKGLACTSVLRHPEHARNPRPFAECFEIEEDEAHCKLEVDASLVPSLVGFWSLKELGFISSLGELRSFWSSREKERV